VYFGLTRMAWMMRAPTDRKSGSKLGREKMKHAPRAEPLQHEDPVVEHPWREH
jgi:hypothetical protein